MDLRAANARLVELRSAVAGLELPDPAEVICPICGLRFRGPRALADHLYVSHDGDVPEHVLAAERRAGIEHDDDGHAIT